MVQQSVPYYIDDDIDELLEGRTFKAVPAGQYTLKLAKWEDTTSKAGNRMFVLRFDVFDVEATVKQTSVFDHFVIPQANWKLGEYVKAAGLSDLLRARESVQNILTEMVASEAPVTAFLSMEQDDSGVDRNSVSRYGDNDDQDELMDIQPPY